MNVVFVTGNPNKAKLFSELVGRHIPNQSADIDEIQSLDIVEVATKKAMAAYEIIKQPVIIEDAGIIIRSMGKMPGPFIKWFVDEIGVESICRLADKDPKRLAVAQDAYAYFDGQNIKYFLGSLEGKISDHPRGNGGWDWDRIFIPFDNDKTMAEMDKHEYEINHLRIKPMKEMKAFLSSIDKT
jgi:non-canonical purine NTP pyrophosphatase (RdgB/HAM1 family)